MEEGEWARISEEAAAYIEKYWDVTGITLWIHGGKPHVMIFALNPDVRPCGFPMWPKTMGGLDVIVETALFENKSGVMPDRMDRMDPKDPKDPKGCCCSIL